jgi:hypothetical protein
MVQNLLSSLFLSKTYRLKNTKLQFCPVLSTGVTFGFSYKGRKRLSVVENRVFRNIFWPKRQR